ncbi:AraC family transcriptional regulator [Clostridioides difficile]|nr:AraC family transcriptional regulator [Clostridioides difficile]
MAIYLEMPKLIHEFPFRTLSDEGEVLTTPHWHKEIEILLITEGVVNLFINDKPMQLKKGEIVIIKGGDIHYILPSPGSERLVFQFDISFFNDLILLNEEKESLINLFSSIKKYSRDWSAKIRKSVFDILIDIYNEDLYKIEGYSYAIKGKMYNLIPILYRQIPREIEENTVEYEINSKEILERLNNIFKYVEKNYKQPIKLEDVSYEVGFSVYYFTKFFKKNTGKTFITFLNEYRLEKAKWILLNNNISIVDLVEEVGFGSTKTFYRVFKEKIGVSPLEFKKRYNSLEKKGSVSK